MKKYRSLFSLILALLMLILCSGCGECEHNYVNQTTLEPSCTEEGKIIYTCSLCNDTYEESIAPLGHTYEEISNTSTCQKSGTVKYKCSVCGETYDESIPATGHIYDSYDGNKCKSCGLEFMKVPKLPITIKNYGGSMEFLRLKGTVDSVRVVRDGRGISINVSGKKTYDAEDSDYNTHCYALILAYEIFSPKGESVQIDRVTTTAFSTGESFEFQIPINFNYKDEETYSIKFYGIFDLYGNKDIMR